MEDSLFRAIGGQTGCRALAHAFYAGVEGDPVLRAVYPASLHCSTESLATFFVQFLGGPCVYSPLRWNLSLREAHSKFSIGPKERRAWLKNMRAAMKSVNIEVPARESLLAFFEEASAYLVNHPPQARRRSGPPLDGELGLRWQIQRSLDSAVSLLRAGQEPAAIAVIEEGAMEEYFRRDPAALLSLLAIMSEDYVARRLAANPDLARERYSGGRTLLHGAAGAGRIDVVRLLLGMRSDSNALDNGGHAPLYAAANECRSESGADIVRALAQAGARVNANGGVKRATALHTAARRGNVAIGEALLECGADLEARDSQGITPLRRAINCRQHAMAGFLRLRGAAP